MSNAYEQLREILDTHPAGAPKSPSFEEILRTLFGEEEAELAVHMSFSPKSVADIAKSAGIPAGEAEKILERMAERAIIFGREKNGQKFYALLPTIPGLFEFPFMKGGNSPTIRKLGKLWEKYHREGMAESFAGKPTPMARVVPVNKSLPVSDVVLPYEKVAELIQKADYIAVAHCACRVSMKKCEAPQEVCLIFGAPAEFLVSRKYAKKITKEKAMELLDLSEKSGLVHITNNSSDRTNFICNCCTCCCTILRGRTQHNIKTSFAESTYVATVNADECSACGTCEERCPMRCATLGKEHATVNTELCIGCGLCVTECPTGAMSLAKRQEPPHVCSSIKEMGIQVAKEKGKLDAFMKIMMK